MSIVENYEVQSWALRTIEAAVEAAVEARGEAKGKAIGEATALLTVLDTRGVAVPDEIRAEIDSCTDLGKLEAWIRRAITAETIDDLGIQTTS